MIQNNSKFCYDSLEKLRLNQCCNSNTNVMLSKVKSIQISSSLTKINESDLDYFTGLNQKFKDFKKSEPEEFIEKIKLIKIIVKAETKIVKFTSIIILIFFISWFPYSLIALVGQFSDNRKKYITPKTAFFPFIFAKISSALNPLFFILTNTRCLNYYKAIFKKTPKKEKKREIILRELKVFNRIKKNRTF